MRALLLFTILSFSLLSCEKYDEEILPLVGTYEGIIVGLTGPFIMSVTAEYGDDVYIDAPFDGEVWSVIVADIDDKEYIRKEINIDRQELSPGVEIRGEGIYFDYSLQLDYTIDYYGDRYDYSLVATKN